MTLGSPSVICQILKHLGDPWGITFYLGADAAQLPLRISCGHRDTGLGTLTG